VDDAEFLNEYRWPCSRTDSLVDPPETVPGIGEDSGEEMPATTAP
jgi:hypothetical protein